MFFAKPSSKVEVINDISDNMVNFYRTIKRDFEGLKSEIDVTLYAEYQYKQAKELWLRGQESCGCVDKDNERSSERGRFSC